MSKPASDPLRFWTRAFGVLGLVLAVLSVLPAVIDFTLLRGEMIVVAILALNTLGPLALLFLMIGAGLWVINRLRR